MAAKKRTKKSWEEELHEIEAAVDRLTKAIQRSVKQGDHEKAQKHREALKKVEAKLYRHRSNEGIATSVLLKLTQDDKSGLDEFIDEFEDTVGVRLSQTDGCMALVRMGLKMNKSMRLDWVMGKK